MSDLAQLGPYRIVRLIGRGGMGEVYEAVHTGLDKRVALKVLPRQMAAARLDRFLREARLAAGLHHTNIVPVFDVGVADGTPYYAMQFIDGRPLGGASGLPCAIGSATATPVTHSFDPDRTTDHISPRPSSAPSSAFQVPSSEACRLILQAADGLAHAHARGVVHRDIKPANLILDDSGVVWVADFGLAFQTDEASMTADGAVLGTPRYMSPEQARADKTIDARTDVFSLGVTLYELITGRPAFAGETIPALLRQVQDVTPPSPRSLDRRVPKDLDTLVTKAMAKRPADRYADAAALASDLRRYLAGEPVKARPISAVGRAWRWAKRKPQVAGLLAAVLLTFAAGAGVSAYFARQSAERAGVATRNYDQAVENANTATKYADDLKLVVGALKEREDELKQTVGKLIEREGENRRFGYAARMTLAAVAYQRKSFDRARNLLAEDTTADLRGWEWRLLSRELIQEPARTITLPGTITGAGRVVYFGPEGIRVDIDNGRNRGEFHWYKMDVGPPQSVPYHLMPRFGYWLSSPLYNSFPTPAYDHVIYEELPQNRTSEKTYRVVSTATGHQFVVRPPMGMKFPESDQVRNLRSRKPLFDVEIPSSGANAIAAGFVYDLDRQRWIGRLAQYTKVEQEAFAAGSVTGNWYVTGDASQLLVWNTDQPRPMFVPVRVPHESQYEPEDMVVATDGTVVALTKNGVLYARDRPYTLPPRVLTQFSPDDQNGVLHLDAGEQFIFVVSPTGDVARIPFRTDAAATIVRLNRTVAYGDFFIRPDGLSVVTRVNAESRDATEWRLNRPSACQVSSKGELEILNIGQHVHVGTGTIWLNVHKDRKADDPTGHFVVERDLTGVARPAKWVPLPDGTWGTSWLTPLPHGRGLAAVMWHDLNAQAVGGLVGAAAMAHLEEGRSPNSAERKGALALFDAGLTASPKLIRIPGGGSHSTRLDGLAEDDRHLILSDEKGYYFFDCDTGTWHTQAVERPRKSMNILSIWSDYSEDANLPCPSTLGPDGVVLVGEGAGYGNQEDKSPLRVLAVRPADASVVREFETVGYGGLDALIYLPRSRQVVAVVQKKADETHRELRIWDWDRPKPADPLVVPVNGPVNISFDRKPLIVPTPAGRTYVASEDRVLLFDLPKWTPAGHLIGDGGTVEFMAVVPGEDRLLVVSSRGGDASLAVWDTAHRQLVTTLPLGKLVAGAKHFDFDGKVFRWLRKGYGDDVWLDTFDGGPIPGK